MCNKNEQKNVFMLKVKERLLDHEIVSSKDFPTKKQRLRERNRTAVAVWRATLDTYKPGWDGMDKFLAVADAKARELANHPDASRSLVLICRKWLALYGMKK